MKVICPNCKAEIPLGDVNVATDIALCRRCGRNFSYAELTSVQTSLEIDLTRPPKGVWFSRNPRGFEVGTTTRSAAAFFLVPFMCVWSGFSLGGIYGTQIYKGHFDWKMSLFGIPFVLGTLLFGSIAVMTVCGKIVLRVENDLAIIFTGVGPIGWRRRFKWSEVQKIEETISYSRNGGQPQITIIADRRINFASGLKSERQQFLLGALRKMRFEK